MAQTLHGSTILVYGLLPGEMISATTCPR